MTLLTAGGAWVFELLPRPCVCSRLLDKDTFLENFNSERWPKKTYLCYEMEFPGGASGVPLGQDKGVLRNRVSGPG